MADLIVQQEGNFNQFELLYPQQENAEPADPDYWLHCQRRYKFQPIYRTSGKLMAIELLTSVFAPSLPQKFISPEKYFANINVEARLQIIIEQLQLLSHWHQRFIRDELLASVNIDGSTLLALQQSGEAKRLITSMPWIRFEMVENQGGLPKEILTRLPEAQTLWLDDFGCGMANFSSLMLAQYDCIKVARELFILLQQSGEGREVFPALIALLARFCNYVVIEGIETKEEWAIVKASHADAAQGYYLSRPQSFDNFDTLSSEF
ncbi:MULTISPECIES: cyclic-guanylate-specific phosphodiesterase [Brenneria]|uniref:Cyclic-guanylate-specific phosphodiesterase n=1 Tax=Brenneria nigrifluens DSM 30175 = ATCC 13028 TaxID=1121120 RepID=A0A2U1UID3_9GAMM|nr:MULTISPECIES: cyclic-guanylate-specific phosphodiesterase [Brenneria]EHD20537.1 diguanylate phosphodiesterase [Brenneria sp. EniD312]PWC21391.1 cyclic-guanylate-specific phosphodiesterase [Brenneria nigrifluens DSM 30175 = ATCC 13028]QCR03730.1 cyclic-guanylate-specific phosphodiesterase [Brenneria nigrifluens DSM 30175 = ATCC 13028]